VQIESLVVGSEEDLFKISLELLLGNQLELFDLLILSVKLVPVAGKFLIVSVMYFL